MLKLREVNKVDRQSFCKKVFVGVRYLLANCIHPAHTIQKQILIIPLILFVCLFYVTLHNI